MAAFQEKAAALKWEVTDVLEFRGGPTAEMLKKGEEFGERFASSLGHVRGGGRRACASPRRSPSIHRLDPRPQEQPRREQHGGRRRRPRP